MLLGFPLLDCFPARIYLHLPDIVYSRILCFFPMQCFNAYIYAFSEEIEFASSKQTTAQWKIYENISLFFFT